MAEADVGGRPRGGDTSLRRLLELFVLCAFAIAQPLLDVTGRSPETFVFYRVDGVEVVVYALLILVVPPVVLWLAVSGIGLLSARAARIAHAVIAGCLIALTVLQAAKKLSGLRGPGLVVIAAAVAVAALWLAARSKNAQSFVTYLSPAPLVFALLFVLTSPTGALVHVTADARPVPNIPPAGARPAAPVVMILLDELPLTSLLDSKGEIDARVYPNFARLAKASHWFRNATGISPQTQYAVPGMLSGRYPVENRSPTYFQHPDNLFSLLAPRYRIRAFESITHLCDPALCDEVDRTGGSQGLRALFGQTWQVEKELAAPYDDDSDEVAEEFSERAAGKPKPGPRLAVSGAELKPDFKSLTANQPDRFRHFLAGLRREDEPTMQFIHLLLPHQRWRYLPSGATHPAHALGLVPGGWGKDAWPIEVNRQAHLLQLAYTDRLLGEVIDRMKARGIWDRSLVVVTSDHGESFVPGTGGRRLALIPQSEAQLAWVPVFLKQPGQRRGTVSDSNWEQVDLLPTMADALGIRVPFKVDGRSQLAHHRTGTTKAFYNEPGKRIEFPTEPAFGIVRKGVTDSFVRGSEGAQGLYVMGSHRDWIGERVSSLPSRRVEVSGETSPMTARVNDADAFHAVDPSSGTVPALVTGTVEHSEGRGDVVIAVNGTVAAVSPVYSEKGEPSFAGIVNDRLFHQGANNLAFYEVVDGSGPGTTSGTSSQLRPIAID